jgi:hypothetical protein
MLTRALHLSISWARSVQSIPSHPISLRPILILSYVLVFLVFSFLLDFPRDHFICSYTVNSIASSLSAEWVQYTENSTYKYTRGAFYEKCLAALAILCNFTYFTHGLPRGGLLTKFKQVCLAFWVNISIQKKKKALFWYRNCVWYSWQQ